MRSMKHKIFLTTILALVLLFALTLVGCGETDEPTPQENVGTLTIANITLDAGESKNITSTFSIPEQQREITYTCDTTYITIANGVVTAKEEVSSTQNITVTAKTEKHSTTFTVTVKPIDYGTVSIDNVIIECDGSANLNAVFSNESKKEELTYTFTGNDISIANGVVSSLATVSENKVIEVTASSTHFNTTFTVTVTPIDYGTVKFGAKSTMTLTIGNKAVLTPIFSKPNRAETLTYTVDEKYKDCIKITENEGVYSIEAVQSDKIGYLTITSEHFNLSIKVTTKATTLTYNANAVTTIYCDYGAFDISHWSYNQGLAEEYQDKDFSYYLSDANGNALTKDLVGVTLNQNGTVSVTEAYAGNSFYITAKSKTAIGTQLFTAKAYDHIFYETATDNLHSRIANLNTYITANATNGVDALFVGDSFFNPGSTYGGYSTGWWVNFYDEWAGTNCYTVGISGAYIEDWEAMLFVGIVKHNPKNVVLHISTNDISVLKSTAEDIIPALETLFNHIHEYLPEAHIYWFTDEPYGSGIPAATVPTNTAMFEYAETVDYLTVLNSYAWGLNEDGSIKTSFYKSDGIHPANESYILFIQALVDTGWGIVPNIISGNIDDIVTTTTSTVAKNTKYIYYKGELLSKNYVLTGKFTISQMSAQTAHIHIGFDGASSNNRLLLWGKNCTTGKMGVGYSITGAVAGNDYEKSYVGEGLTTYFRIWHDGTNAYFYLGTSEDTLTLVAVMYNAKRNALAFATESCAVSFTELSAYTLTKSPTEYNNAVSTLQSLTPQNSEVSVTRY